ncbi:LEA type 2 family protein [Pseudomonas sp. NPDC007930]|uniref:LEA type 2 family protein n=1 Tax=Pseudomonas sp. NPDC007930 TaxID=3364417 RepID=UPI0036EF0E5B
MTRLPALAAVILAVCLSGCSTAWLTDRYQDPDVRLLQVERVKTRLLEQRFILHFRIDNPNSSALPVRGFRYKVTLEGIPLAEGTASDWFSVPAAGTSFYNVEVRTNLWQHLKALRAVLKDTSRPVHYEFKGELKTGIFFGHRITLRRSDAIIPANFIPE